MTSAKGGARLLEAHSVVVNFAGLLALDKVTMQVGVGEIVGLIGPNGSGKTTLVNVISGAIPPTAGRVIVNGTDVTGRKPYRITRAGVARTFQSVRLFGTLSVAENIELAGLGTGSSRSTARRRARELIDRFDLGDLAEVPAGSLAYGQERTVEIARALATGATFLLLDEPAAGLNETESAALLAKLSQVPEAFGCGILIIDHDMNLIMRLCDRLHVLNEGRTIAEGNAAQIRSDPVVVEAYLGSAGADAAGRAS